MSTDMPADFEIENLAREVQETAAKVRGLYELRYVPEPPHYDSYCAGRRRDPTAWGASSSWQAARYAADENENFLGTAEQWAALRASYDWIPDAFMNEVGILPVEYDPSAQDMETVARSLKKDVRERPDGGPSQITEDVPLSYYLDQTRSYVDNWIGPTAVDFKSLYLGKIEDAARNQVVLAEILQHAMIANMDILRRSRQDLAETARKTIVALEALDPYSGGGSGDVSVTFAVIAAVATVGAGIATLPIGGAGAPALTGVFTVVAGASSGLSVATAGAAKPREPAKSDLAAETVDDVLKKMSEAIGMISKHVYEQEEEIISSLNENMEALAANRDLLVPPRPNLIETSRNPDIQDPRSPHAFLPP